MQTPPVKRFLSVALGVAMAAMLAGCNAPQAAGTQPPAGSAPAASTGEVKPKVDRLVMAVDFAVSNETNQLRRNSSPDVWIFRSAYEYPIALDINNEKLVPGLATEWSVEENGLAYRVKIRKGVKFHGDYGDVTAKDFVHMWKDITGPEGIHGQTAYWRTSVKDVEIVNDYEVVYRLTKPDAQFTLALSETQGGAEIRSKAKYDKDGGAPTDLNNFEAGTGWYQPVARQSSSYLRLKRPDFPHWDSVKPEFPEFEFRFLKEPSTRLASLLTGEVQVSALPEDLLKQAQASGMKLARSIIPGLRIMGSFQCCYLNDAKDGSKGYKYPDTPLLDARVRKALNKAVNKDELNKAFFGGKGMPMYLNSFLPTREGWNPDWEKRYAEEYGYDTNAAKALLAQAGYTADKPLKTTVLVTPVPGVAAGPDIEEAIAGYWRAIGVNVELQPADNAEISAKNKAFTYSNHLWVRGTGANQWTGTTVYNSAQYGTGGNGVNNADFEKVVSELTVTYDEKKREELWRKAGDIMFNTHMTLSLFWLPAEAVVNPTIVGDWKFPGTLTGTWTHVQNIKAAR